MRKMSRILSFFMACVICFSDFNISTYAAQSVSTNHIESEMDGDSYDEEVKTEEAMSEEGEIIEETSDVSGNEIQDIENLDKIKDDGVLDFEAVRVDWDKIEGEIYDAEELYELAENSPSCMSDSYGAYWDNYTSYYMYNQLDEAEKKFWIAMEVLCTGYLESDKNLSNGVTDYVKVKTSDLTEAELLKLANIFKYSHPQYYYLMSGYSYSSSGGYTSLAFMVYDAFINGSNRKSATTTINNLLEEWDVLIDECTTEEKKVKKIHDLICNKVDYNHDAVDAGIFPVEQEEFTQSAYSVFCLDETVCAGYTQAFMWLCNGADIECFGVTSPGHAWNKVKVNDNWYNMDCTWNDGDGVGNISYWCYLKNDENIDSYGGHNEDEEWIAYIPECTLDSGSNYSTAKSLPVITEQAAQPVIHVVREDKSYMIQLSSSTEGAKIYYTLDGHIPSEGNSKSYIYREPFRVNDNELIQAIAVCDRYLDSEIAERHCETIVMVQFITGTEQVIEEESYEENSLVKEPILAERPGYTFDAWYSSEEIQDETTKWDFSNDTIKEDMTLYARWIANSYMVNFEAEKGNISVKQKEVTYDQPYGELPVPVLTGYTFTGWYTEENGGNLITEDTLYTVVGDSALYAQYEPNKYIITFDANGGRTEVWEKEVSYHEMYGELPIPVLMRAEFLGWYTEPREGIKIEEETQVELLENQTLYAHWAYKDSVEIPEASVSSEEVIEPGTRVLLSSKTLGNMIYYTTDPDIGMKVTKENGILYEDAIVVNENMTIYAFAVKDFYNDSPVMTISYTVKDRSKEWGDVSENDCREIGVTKPSEIPQELWIAGVTDFDYTGKAVTCPMLRVYHHKTLLSENIDYTVKYKNNVKAGTATVTIKGKGNYSGSAVKTFQIRPLDIKDAIVQDITLEYTGKMQKGITAVTYLLGEKTITLKKGTDFTYTYPGTDKKNVADYDANAFVSVGEHTVQITGKGNYKGTKEFKEYIVNEYVIGKMKLEKIPKQTYTGEEIKPEIVLKNGNLTLEENVHYKVEYKDYKEVGTATVIITGIRENGYAGTRIATFQIVGIPLSKAKMEGFSTSLPWKKDGVTQDVTFSYIKETEEGSQAIPLKENTDYKAEYSENNTKVGTATVTFTGMGGYTGTIKKTYKITGTPLKNVVVNDLKTVVKYDGKNMEQDSYILTYTDAEGKKIILKEDEDYAVKYKNHHKAGTATVTFTGIGGYTGNLKKTYQIEAYDLNGSKVQILNIPAQTYTKAGVTPKPVVIYHGEAGDAILEEGKDYTLKYSNNKALAKKTETKAPMVSITGKNGFKNKVDIPFTIVKSNLSEVEMTVKDVVYQKKANICKPVLTLTDTNGKKLKAGTDYHKVVKYTYVRDVEVTQVQNKKVVYILRKAGEEVHKNDIIPVGTEVIAAVTGINNYAGTQKAVFRYVLGDLSKASVKVDNQIYTGKGIEPNKDAVTVKIGRTQIAKKDYEIVEYSNNLKKGTARITIEARGNYGGRKTVTFKINAKSMKDVWEKLNVAAGW